MFTFRCRIIWALLAATVGIGTSSCIGSWFKRPAGFDSRSVTIQTVSFFNQRRSSRFASHPWKNDWVFRRDRLELIDHELRDVKPDILVMQEVMGKFGHASESDRNILLAGALQDYDWYDIRVRTDSDTRMEQSLAVATGLPLRIQRPRLTLQKEFLPLGSDGFMAFFVVELEGQPVTIVNIQMPTGAGSLSLWFPFVAKNASAFLQRRHLCPRRLVIAGYLPADRDINGFNQFTKALDLKDVTRGFCDEASRCYTATPTNDLFMASLGDETPALVDRILVHEETFLNSSARNFLNSKPSENYRERYGIARLWPTQRFGWLTSLRLPRCNADELVP